MHLLQILDIDDNNVQLTWQPRNAIARHYSPISITDPLSSNDRKELRWYLEEYLEFPYGAERDRAQRVVRNLEHWGSALFSQVFSQVDKEPNPRMFYQEAVREGLENCLLCISSENPIFLNYPWELLYDPTPGRGFLAPSMGGLFRQRSGHKIETSLEIQPGEPFRILLVIARPFGRRDIPLSTIARPIIEALRPLSSHFQLDVLRPPTFDALQQKLNRRRGYYQLVHFDGHGQFITDASSQRLRYGAKSGKGYLVFETIDG